MDLAIKEQKVWLSVLCCLPNSKRGARQFRVLDEHMWLNEVSSSIILISCFQVTLFCSTLSWEMRKFWCQNIKRLSINTQPHLCGRQSGDWDCASSCLCPVRRFLTDLISFPFNDSARSGRGPTESLEPDSNLSLATSHLYDLEHVT